MRTTHQLASITEKIKGAESEQEQPAEALTYVYPVSQLSPLFEHSNDASTELPVVERALSMLSLNHFNWVLPPVTLTFYPVMLINFFLHRLLMLLLSLPRLLLMDFTSLREFLVYFLMLILFWLLNFSNRFTTLESTVFLILKLTYLSGKRVLLTHPAVGLTMPRAFGF